MDNYNGDLVKVLSPKWLPVTGPVQTELLAIIRHELRPTPVEHQPHKEAAQNRLDFEAAIEHRPEPEAPGSDASRSRRSLPHRPTTRRFPQQTTSPASH